MASAPVPLHDSATPALIEVSGSSILIRELLVDSPVVTDYVRSLQEPARTLAVVQALEVGAHCLERASTTRDVDFVRTQVASLLAQVEKAVEQIPETVERGLVAKIGAEDGQVLAPVRLLLSDVRSTSSERLKEVQTLLAEEIDPSRESSTLGKALRNLTSLLDPRRTDSVQGAVHAAVQSVAATDGALANAVKNTVADAVAPLATEVNRLALEFRGDRAVEEALQRTTAKGTKYELKTLATLSEWARHTGARVAHVGEDNKPGDIVVEVPDAGEDSVRIAIEARDRRSALGRKGIAETLEKAMCVRRCCAAIYISQTTAGLTEEIGEWAEGTCTSGEFVATVDEHLVTALRFLLVQRRIARLKEAQRCVDEAAVQRQVARIKTALTRIATIKRRVGDVRASADTIESENEALRADIRGALMSLEDALSPP